MRRVATAVVLLAALGLAIAGVASSSLQGSSTKLTIWVGWSAGHELKEFQKVVAEYDQKNDDVEVQS